MPVRKSSETSKARHVGRKTVAPYRELSQVQEVWLGLIVAYCLKHDTAVFIASPNTTGSLRINFYLPDDKCAASLNVREDWSIEIPIILSDVFGEEVTERDLLLACPWTAERAVAPPAAPKPIVKAGT